MKLLTASVVGLALIASPVLAQQNNTMSPDQQSTTTTHVKSTTKHVHATNAPRSSRRTRRHAMRCGCPRGHMKMHHVKHVVKKTTTSSSSSSS